MSIAVVDFSTNPARVVLFERDRPVIWGRALLPEGAVQSGLLTDVGGAATAIDTLFRQWGARPESAAFVLPAGVALDRVVQVPPVKGRDLARLAEAEAVRQLGVEPSLVRIYWREVDRGQRVRLYLLAVLREAVDAYRPLFRALGVRPGGLHVLTLALAGATGLETCHIAHLNEEGQLTFTGIDRGVPVVGSNVFLEQGTWPVQAIEQAVRSASRMGGQAVPTGSVPLVLVGPGATGRLRRDLMDRGLAVTVPDLKIPLHGLDPSEFGACIGAPRSLNLLDYREPVTPPPAFRWALAFAFLLAATAVAGWALDTHVLQPGLRLAEARLEHAQRLALPYADALPALQEHQQAGLRVQTLERDLAAVLKPGPDLAELIARLQFESLMSKVTLRNVTPERTQVTVTGRAPSRNELNAFVGRLAGGAAFERPRITQFANSGAAGIDFTVVAELKGREGSR